MIAIIFFTLVLTATASFETFFNRDTFIKETLGNVLNIIQEGVSENAKLQSDRYFFNLHWDDDSNQNECRYCEKYAYSAEPYIGSVVSKRIIEKDVDVRDNDFYVFPTHKNTKIVPMAPTNLRKTEKEEATILLFKKIMEMFPDIEVYLFADTCCHRYILKW